MSAEDDEDDTDYCTQPMHSALDEAAYLAPDAMDVESFVAAARRAYVYFDALRCSVGKGGG